MPDIDRTVLLEALSALTGTTVRALSERKRESPALKELTVDNFLSTVYDSRIIPYEPSPQSCAKLLRRLTLSDLHLLIDREPETGASALRRELLVDLEKFLDPDYDYDFRQGPDSDSDSDDCSRGGEPYTRPWGWYRFALKVLDKYPDGNRWLGTGGWRSHSSRGEWPVSFHGTSIEGAKAIVRSHYKTGPGEVYGRGIYSTPDIEQAEFYAMRKKFRSEKNGKTYLVMMQNRINPEKRVVTDEELYWLIPVPEGTSVEEEKEIVEESIRPYGILIREYNPDSD